jgi:hypothetical protein
MAIRSTVLVDVKRLSLQDAVMGSWESDAMSLIAYIYRLGACLWSSRMTWRSTARTRSEAIGTDTPDLIWTKSYMLTGEICHLP